MAAPVIVRVGCALDGSVERTFGDLERRARRAGKAVEGAVGKTGAGAGGGAAAAARAAEKAQTAAVTQGSRDRLRIIRQEARERAREHRSLLTEVAREEKRAAAKMAADTRQAARAATRQQQRDSRELDRFATRTSHRATRFLTPNMPLASLARRGASDVMRGLGIDTSISGGISRSRDIERSATALSTAGYQSGATGAAGTRVGAQTLMTEARQTADALSLDPQSVIDANEQYVKLTGNLQEARSLQRQLGELAIATGSSFEDIAGAAGEASNALGTMPAEQKLGAIMEVLRGAASQGKIGSVEMEDFAKYYAHLGGTAGQFGGDRAKTMGQFGALVQLSKKYGGATSAAVATRSISGLGNTLSTPARRAQFKEFGVDIEDDKGLFRDPLEILKDSIRNTGGDTESLKKMWSNVVGAKPAMALSNIYKGAGGGDAGMAAIEKELAEQLNASTMSQKAIDDAVARNAETAAAKAQRFQNQLDRITESAATKLIPALEKLAPTALKVADGMARLIQWVADNPGQALIAAVAAVIVRAGLESVFRAGIERAIKGALTGGGGVPLQLGGGTAAAGGGAGGASNMLGPAVGAAAIGAIGAIYEGAALAGNRKGGAGQTGVDDWTLGSFAGNVLPIGWAATAAGDLAGGATVGETWERSGPAKAMQWLTDFAADPSGEAGANQAAKAEAVARAAALQTTELQRTNAILSNGLRVEVTNPEAIRGPAPPGTVDPSGRDPG